MADYKMNWNILFFWQFPEHRGYNVVVIERGTKDRLHQGSLEPRATLEIGKDGESWPCGTLGEDLHVKVR